MKHYKCMVNLNTVDGSEIRRSPVDIANRPVIARVSYMSGGCLCCSKPALPWVKSAEGPTKKDPKKDTLLGTNIYPFYSRHFWADDFPNFPRWDMWSFPGDYLVNLLLKGPALTWFHSEIPHPLKLTVCHLKMDGKGRQPLLFIFGTISAYFSGANLLLSFRFRVIPILVVE